MLTTADSPWGEFHAEHPGFEVDTDDSTGAGDAFTAAFIHFSETMIQQPAKYFQ